MIHLSVEKQSKKRETLKAFSSHLTSQDPLIQEILKQWYNWALETITVGCVAVKYPYQKTTSSKPKKRFVILSKDQSKLLWGTSREYDKLNRVLPISSIKTIIYGPYSSTFSKFATEITEKWRCISIVCQVKKKDRTIDLKFETDIDALAWLIGLSHLLNKESKISPIIGDSIIHKLLASYKWTKFKLQLEQVAEKEKKNLADLIIDTMKNLK